MSELEYSPSPQKEHIRRAILVGQNIGLNSLFFVALGIYLVIQYGTWHGYAGIFFPALAAAGGFTGVGLAKQGRLDRAGWVILIPALISPASSALVILNLSYVAIAYMLIAAFFIISYAMEEKSRGKAILATGILLLFPIAAEVFSPAWRLEADFLTKAGPVATGILSAAIIFIILQRALTGGNVRMKLLVPTLVFIGLLFAGVIAYETYLSIQQSDAAEAQQLETMHETFLARISSAEDLAVALAIESAKNPDIQKAFAEKDREWLTELTLPGYEEINARFDIPQNQFHLPPATSFLRLHSLDKYGDDLSTIRFTVLKANEEEQVVSGIEIGRAGLGIRGVSPVSYQGEHIGTVEFGFNFDESLLQTLKDNYGYDFQLAISKKAAEVATFTTPETLTTAQSDLMILAASTLTEPFFAGEDKYIEALAGGEPSIEHITVDNRELAIHTVPVVDFSGEIIGTLDIIADHTAIATQQRNQVIVAVAILLSALLIVGVGFSFIANRTLRPIGILTAASNAISAGDFTKTAKVESNDELGTLARTFNSMAAQIEENVRTLEERVAERTRAQEIVAEVATAVATIPDLHEMLARTVHLTQRGFGLYHAHVFTYHEDTEELKIVACGYQEGDKNEGTHGTSSIPMAQEQSLVARAARTREAVIVNDVRNEPGWLPNPLLPDTRAELAVPMIVGDKLLGVLDVQAAHLDAFTDADANIQTTLASQIATSMQNLLQYDTSQKVAADLSVVAEVGIAITTITDKNLLLQEVVDLSKKSFGLYHAHIYLINDAGDSLDLASGAGEIGRTMVVQGLSIPLDREQSLVARAARTQEGIVVNDVTQDANFLPNPLLPDTRAEMAVPMIVAGKVIGVLDIQSEQVGRFTKVDVNIQTTLASQIAVALENARSFENTQKQAEQETKLNLITQKIQQTGTIEEAMQIAARELGRALGSPKTLVSLNTGVLTGGDEAVSNDETPGTPEITETGVEK